VEERIETPFEAAEVMFEREEEEEEGEEREDREEREVADERGGRRRRRRRRPRSDRGEAPTVDEGGERLREDEIDERVPSAARAAAREEEDEDEDELEGEFEEDSPARKVRINVPSWSDAIGDIIARNMSGRSKQPSGGGNRRGRGRGRRPGPPRDRQ
jgi:ribonuclease E